MQLKMDPLGGPKQRFRSRGVYVLEKSAGLRPGATVSTSQLHDHDVEMSQHVDVA